jgi:two-component system phosphate regulon sensor histidine kinase PhoR
METNIDKNLQKISRLELENKQLIEKLNKAEEAAKIIKTEKVDAVVIKNDKQTEIITLGTTDQTYRLFVQQMKEGAVTLNPDGLVLYSNLQFAAMVKEPIEYIIGSNFYHFIPNESKKIFDDLFTLSLKEDAKGELNILDNEKKLIYVLFSLNRLQLKDSLIISIVITDLTKHKAEEEELKIKNQQLKTANKELAVNTKILEEKTLIF